jgi:hypothetical protein
MLRLPKRLREAQSPSHARAKVQEKKLAERVGGRVTKGSGNGLVKGDVRLKGIVRLEAKVTKNSSFSVTTEIVKKLEDAVVGAGEIPILQVELELGRHKLIVMPDWALDLVLEALSGTAAKS